MDACAPLSALPFDAATHLRLALLGVIARLIEVCTDPGGTEAALRAHPFLADYAQELRACVPNTAPLALSSGRSFHGVWRDALGAWETLARAQGRHLPLLALRDAGLSELEVELLLAVGLIEEDPRFGQVFDGAPGDGTPVDGRRAASRRPSIGVLMAWWRDAEDGVDRAGQVRASLQRLIELGLLNAGDTDLPRPDWSVSVPPSVWDALRAPVLAESWLRFVPIERLPNLDAYIASPATRATCIGLPLLLQSRPAPVLLIRGPARNGRRTLAGALARELDRSLLLAQASVLDDPTRWRLFGVLSVLLDAVPAIGLDLASGERRDLPEMALSTAPLLVVSGAQGAWRQVDSRPMLSIELPMPEPEQRLRHWREALPEQSLDALQDFAARWRLSSGGIARVAASAAGFARAAGRDAPEETDLRRACRTLQDARLDTLATRLEPSSALHALAADAATCEELDALTARCRWREALAADSAGTDASGVGVRALFAGPSGTGKTLAARRLAAQLGKELYRIDLAATVNKYIGETEKNLDRALSAAEELDVVLLLDEGDALMAARTDVSSSNDRYANLETNFLLQRIESFQGIVLITSNAADRIDRAFARRMDVVVNFRPPDAWRRYEILRLHLGPADIDEQWLQDAATRCTLSGGQWRNVVLHARLLSLQDGAAMRTAHMHASLLREYRKHGGACPLRPWPPERPAANA
ncbi:ATP-binding protein [Lysobacter sp. CA199]|uniref:AAA family ATPase n=1 Tax=Lysobacter sp. CA199 TaxID=3455608 RepID=UPI003F8D196A